MELLYTDWSAESAHTQDMRLRKYLDEDQRKRFDFRAPPLLRLALIKLGETDYRFIWSFHHAIIDGWSVPLVLKEVFAAYDALRHGQQVTLPPARPFRDYIAWLAEQDKTAAENFWRKQLAGFTAPTALPEARSQTSLQDTDARFAELPARLPAATVARLREIARQQRLTLNTVVQGAWAMLLGRYSGDDDIVFGATTSGRPAEMPGVESMIGLFLNTLPLRVQVDHEARLLEWLQALQDTQLEVRQHEYASLVEIQGWSDVPRGTPMFETLLAFENYPEMETMWTSTDSIEIREVEGFDRTNFPLTVNVAVFDEMHMRIAYDERLFDTRGIERLVEHFVMLLNGIAENPDRKLGDLSMITPAERRTALVEWNSTKRDYPADATLVSLFEAQVEKTPDAPAVTCADTTLSYREFNARANQLAADLIARGVGPETLVGVCMERSIEMVTALYGILKAGGAYVPLDPEYPRERLADMLSDAGIAILLTQSHLIDVLPDNDATTIALDTEWPSDRRQPGHQPECAP